MLSIWTGFLCVVVKSLCVFDSRQRSQLVEYVSLQSRTELFLWTGELCFLLPTYRSPLNFLIRQIQNLHFDFCELFRGWLVGWCVSLSCCITEVHLTFRAQTDCRTFSFRIFCGEQNSWFLKQPQTITQLPQCLRVDMLFLWNAMLVLYQI